MECLVIDCMWQQRFRVEPTLEAYSRLAGGRVRAERSEDRTPPPERMWFCDSTPEGVPQSRNRASTNARHPCRGADRTTLVTGGDASPRFARGSLCHRLAVMEPGCASSRATRAHNSRRCVDTPK